MNLLAIDTATENCSVALKVSDEVFDHNELAGRRQTERILPMIDSLLQQAGIGIQQIDGIVLGRGPGAFTGLRVAAGVAQGLAYAAGVPIIPVSSLQILAQTAHRLHGWSSIACAFDARMSEMYWAGFKLDNDIMQLCTEEVVSAPGEIQLDAEVPWSAVGPGWFAYPDAVTMKFQQCVNLVPQAQDAIVLAETFSKTLQAVEPQAAIPVYVRNDVAWKTGGRDV